jgi:hypothetical protein
MRGSTRTGGASRGKGARVPKVPECQVRRNEVRQRDMKAAVLQHFGTLDTLGITSSLFRLKPEPTNRESLIPNPGSRIPPMPRSGILSVRYDKCPWNIS